MNTPISLSHDSARTTEAQHKMTTTKKTQRNLPWTILVLLGVFFLVVQSLKGFQGSQSRPRSLSIIDIPYKHPSEQYNQTTATNETNYYATPDIPRHGDVFAPGSLSISRLNAYKKCFVDPTKYAKHIRDRRICEISTKYNLTYFMIAKAGSSTCRHVMKKFFEATETKCQNEQLNSLGLGTRNDSMFHFTFVREPSSRFLSSYQEAIKKSFYNNHEIAIPQQYVDSFLTPIKRFKYGELFNTALGQRIFQQTTENFIMTYDGNIPFEGHLRLQLPRLYNPQSKRTFPLEGIYDTKTMEQDFHQQKWCPRNSHQR